ncbi:MAG: Monocarboxylate 2-oxoacid-binding periplasmic protein [Alphaproteobacteria bacterium MarineAlpha9_Bin3]|nr:MAG: Monocarboxylate 2-oxoacid-binding periplasmic protein [Alphaproteobacteria bacterium MarineAlpha9_Bin3]|tara:strand:- start:5635 stop:6711 length:1077 start_codon:yes stop_codon:yes gene_type:complete
MKKILIHTFIALIATTFLISCDNSNDTNNTDTSSKAQTVRWKMASTFPGNLNIIGEGGINFTKRLETVSGGNIKVKFFEPGALVPPLEIFDAVSSGAVDAGWSTAGYWAGKIPAVQFFSAVPFGPNASEFLAWYHEGGGKELWEEIYARHNLHPVQCEIISPEASGWFRKEITSIDDIKGLKMRFFGLGAKVMDKVGASTQLLAGGDIYPALELGTIDATEFAMPSIDLDLGFYQIAKHYYFPGWHQPASALELMVNLDKWNALSDSQRAQIEATCTESVVKSLAMAESRQPKALEELQAKGVTLHRWSDEILKTLEDAWLEVVKEEAAKDEDFAKVWASLSEFRKSYKTWKDLGFVD